MTEKTKDWRDEYTLHWHLGKNIGRLSDWVRRLVNPGPFYVPGLDDEAMVEATQWLAMNWEKNYYPKLSDMKRACDMVMRERRRDRYCSTCANKRWIIMPGIYDTKTEKWTLTYNTPWVDRVAIPCPCMSSKSGSGINMSNMILHLESLKKVVLDHPTDPLYQTHRSLWTLHKSNLKDMEKKLEGASA